MSVETLKSVRLSKTVTVDRQRAWDAWTQPDQMKQWASPEYATVVGVGVDLRVGGQYRIEMSVEGDLHVAHGSYKEIDPPARLVYTWDWEGPHAMGVETVVTVDFLEVDGGTEVRVTHEGLPSDEVRDSHLQGWSSCLEGYDSLFTAP